jgi:hypothetical protein
VFFKLAPPIWGCLKEGIALEKAMNRKDADRLHPLLKRLETGKPPMRVHDNELSHDDLAE